MPFQKGNKHQLTTRSDVSKRNRELKSKIGIGKNFWVRVENEILINELKSIFKDRIFSGSDIEKIKAILNEEHV